MWPWWGPLLPEFHQWPFWALVSGILSCWPLGEILLYFKMDHTLCKMWNRVPGCVCVCMCMCVCVMELYLTTNNRERSVKTQRCKTWCVHVCACTYASLCFKRQTPPSPMQTAFYTLFLKSSEQSCPYAKTGVKCSYFSLVFFWKCETPHTFGVDHSGFLPFPSRNSFFMVSQQKFLSLIISLY